MNRPSETYLTENYPGYKKLPLTTSYQIQKRTLDALKTVTIAALILFLANSQTQPLGCLPCKSKSTTLEGSWMESLGVYSLNKKPMINGGSTVSRPNPYVIDVDAVAIFSITANLTNLMKVSGRKDRSYIVLPDQLTVTRKNLPLTKK